MVSQLSNWHPEVRSSTAFTYQLMHSVHVSSRYHWSQTYVYNSHPVNELLRYQLRRLVVTFVEPDLQLSSQHPNSYAWCNTKSCFRYDITRSIRRPWDHYSGARKPEVESLPPLFAIWESGDLVEMKDEQGEDEFRRPGVEVLDVWREVVSQCLPHRLQERLLDRLQHNDRLQF